MANKFSPHGGAFMLQTISWGTLRDEDLIRAFVEEIERLAPFSYRKLCREGAQWLIDNYEGEEPQDGPEIVNDLFDALNDIAAHHGAWFGSLEGDGSDFAFQSYNEDDGYDEDEFPDDYEAQHSAYLTELYHTPEA